MEVKVKMWNECKGCVSIKECSTAVQPNSIACITKRISNGQTKWQQIEAAGEKEHFEQQQTAPGAINKFTI
jgi:hypothetical protein